VLLRSGPQKNFRPQIHTDARRFNQSLIGVHPWSIFSWSRTVRPVVEVNLQPSRSK
jgi:hypothetical protein